MKGLVVGIALLVLLGSGCFFAPQSSSPTVSSGSGLPAATAIAYATDISHAAATTVACYHQQGTWAGC